MKLFRVEHSNTLEAEDSLAQVRRRQCLVKWENKH